MSQISWMFLVLGLLVLTFTVLSITKSKWGINLRPIICPDCGPKPYSSIRIPANEQQALWGV